VPDDYDALHARGIALWMQGRERDATTALDQLLLRSPQHETLLRDAATLATQLQRPEALGYWQRAVAINPWRWEHHQGLATACAQGRDWPNAVAACRKALSLNPAALDVRRLLIICLVESGNLAQARTELETLLAFNPPDKEGLRQKYEGLLR
jgi:Flp pilus assembly protein TadD